MRRLLIFCGIFFLLSNCLIANSIRLYNDSPYKLRAVVRAADGTYLGEMILVPQSATIWTDSYSQLGSRPPTGRSQTPYVVQWYCLDGGDYAICNNVATGATILAQSCEGGRICKPKPPLPGEEQKENLDNENAVPYNPYLPNSPYNPNNPNSPYSPYNPNNPQSPYSPSNPKGPYNPKNPQSPFYQPEGGVTGAAPENKMRSSSAQRSFDPLWQEISDDSGANGGLQDFDPNSLFNRYHPDSPYNSRNHNNSNGNQQGNGMNQGTYDSYSSPGDEDQNSLFNRYHPDSPYNSKNHNNSRGFNGDGQTNGMAPNSSHLEKESQNADLLNFFDPSSPYNSKNHGTSFDGDEDLGDAFSAHIHDGHTHTNPQCPYRRPRSQNQRPVYHNKERIPRGNYKRPDSTRTLSQTNSSGSSRCPSCTPSNRDNVDLGPNIQSPMSPSSSQENESNRDMPYHSPMESDSYREDSQNMSPSQQDSLNKNAPSSSENSNRNDWKNLPYRQRDFYSNKSSSYREDTHYYSDEPIDHFYHENFYEEHQNPPYYYEEDDYYQSNSDANEDVQYYYYP